MDEFYLKCECQNEVLVLTNVREDRQVNIALYSYGQVIKKPSIWQRIKFAWYHLLTGKIYTDAVVINHEQAEQLAEWLSKVRQSHPERSVNQIPERTTNTTHENTEHRT